ncbi:MAG: MBL fold metallo-hydrolase [Thermomicrobiales bacterium]
MTLSLQFLGTGTSTGVPVIGCDCHVCRSDDSRDRRLRSSVVIRSDETTILIDTTPDLREQALQADLRQLDAVLFTHAHADHTAGLDELRSFNALQNEHIPVWATRETGVELESRFAYAFADTFPRYGLKPDLTLSHIMGPFQVNELTVTPIPIMHGRLPIVGFRIGDIAYLTDLKTYPESSADLLKGLDILVITALRQDPHPAHLTLAESLLEIERIAPKRAFLTHISHDFGLYKDVADSLPAHVQIGIDGKRFTSNH